MNRIEPVAAPLLLVLVLMCGFGESAAHQTESAQISLRFVPPTDTDPVRTITAGVHVLGTTCLDSQLGESEIPLLPPEGLYPVLVLPEECEDEFSGSIMTKIDRRGIPEQQRFAIEYNIYVQREAGQKMTIRWDRPLNQLIDSAVLKDPLEFAVPNINLATVEEIEVENEFINRLILTIWYNLGPVSVGEKAEDTVFRLFPNPTSGELHISDTNGLFQRAEVYSLQLRLLQRTELYGGVARLELAALPSGTYFVRLVERDGTAIWRQISKL